MKNIIKYSILTLTGLILFMTSCVDEDAYKVPDFEDGANVRISVDPEFSGLNADDLANAKLVFSVFSENKTIQSVVLSGSYTEFATDSLYDKVIVRTWTQADFNANNGAIRDVTLTADELAQLFGKASFAELSGGDRFDFFNVTTLTNGMVFPDTISLATGDVLNVTPNIIGGAATTSFTVGFTAFVSCPFVASDAAGTYVWILDGWGDWTPGQTVEVVENADGTGVIVLGLYSILRSDNRGPYDVEILVNAANGIATVEKQEAWQYFWYTGTEGYGTGSVEGGGFVFSCSGVITLNLKHTVAAGSFGTYPMLIQRQ